MSFSRDEWTAFIAFLGFVFVDLFGERVAAHYGRHRKWYADALGKGWWFRVMPYIFVKIIVWGALTFEFVAGFLFWKNSSSSSDYYTAALALYVSSSIARRFWFITLFGWSYAWIGLLWILGSLITAIIAFSFFIVEDQGVSAGLYAVYGLWLIFGLVLNICVLWTGSHYKYLRMNKRDRSLEVPAKHDPEYDFQGKKLNFEAGFSEDQGYKYAATSRTTLSTNYHSSDHNGDGDPEEETLTVNLNGRSMEIVYPST